MSSGKSRLVTEAPIRLALIGLGSMGTAHLEVFSSLTTRAQIVALADSHPPFADRAALRAPSAAVFYDPLDCLNNANIDAAVVATADDTHHEIVDACIARSVYVLCEKPLTTSADQSLHLVEAERAKGPRIVQVGYMRRYDDDYCNTYDALRSGRVGEPILISQRHRNPLAVNNFDARKLIANTASHDIDIFRWLTGEEITEVSATTKISQDKNTVTVVLTLKSQSGILGVVELGRGPGLPYGIGCEIVGSRGVLTVAPATSTCDGWKVKRIRNTPRVTIAKSAALGKPKSEQVEAVARVLPKSETRRVYSAVLKWYWYHAWWFYAHSILRGGIDKVHIGLDVRPAG